MNKDRLEAQNLAQENKEFFDHLDSLPIDRLIDELIIEHGIYESARYNHTLPQRDVEHLKQRFLWTERTLRERIHGN